MLDGLDKIDLKILEDVYKMVFEDGETIKESMYISFYSEERDSLIRNFKIASHFFKLEKLKYLSLDEKKAFRGSGEKKQLFFGEYISITDKGKSFVKEIRTPKWKKAVRSIWRFIKDSKMVVRLIVILVIILILILRFGIDQAIKYIKYIKYLL